MKDLPERLLPHPRKLQQKKSPVYVRPNVVLGARPSTLLIPSVDACLLVPHCHTARLEDRWSRMD